MRYLITVKNEFGTCLRERSWPNPR